MKTIIFIIASVIFIACAKDDLNALRTDVCNQEWDCSWTYDMFYSEYGNPDSLFITGTSPYLVREVYWHCETPVEEGGIEILIFFATFSNNELTSYCFIKP